MEMLLISALRFICEQKRNTNTAFPTPGLICHLAVSEPSAYQDPLGCQRVKVGSGANDKLLINLQEIKRNLDLIR